MNEKRWIIFIVSILLFSLSCCCTRAAVHGNSGGAYTVRENLGELADEQTESAIASERLNGAIEDAREQSEQLSSELTASREHSEQLERSITDGEADLEALTAILRRIRKRGRKPDSGTAGNN